MTQETPDKTTLFMERMIGFHHIQKDDDKLQELQDPGFDSTTKGHACRVEKKQDLPNTEKFSSLRGNYGYTDHRSSSGRVR